MFGIYGDYVEEHEVITMVMDGDQEGVRREVLSNKEKINSLYNDQTLLNAACLSGKREIACFLLENKADVNTRGKSNNTPLLSSLNGFYGDLPQMLVEKKADPCAENDLGWNALHIAASRNRAEIVEYLLKKVDINSLTKANTTALYLACMHGDQAVQVLLEHKADMCISDAEGLSPLYFAAKHKNEEAVRILLAAKADVDQRRETGETALFVAAMNDSVNIARMLLEANARPDIPNKSGQIPIYIACQYGYTEMFRMLLDYKLSKLPHLMTQPLSKTQLHISTERGYMEIMQELLKKCHNVLQE